MRGRSRQHLLVLLVASCLILWLTLGYFKPLLPSNLDGSPSSHQTEGLKIRAQEMLHERNQFSNSLSQPASNIGGEHLQENSVSSLEKKLSDSFENEAMNKPLKADESENRNDQQDKEGLWQPVHLSLSLPAQFRDDPILNNRESMYRQYGFNLKFSNELPLDRDVPDIRSDVCKAIKYPHDMPKCSIIIIFYNEPLSTLLRNILSVLNRTPVHLLGEIILVDDNSTLLELKYLLAHLEKLHVPRGMVKLFKRDVHDGIVGARVRGAQEASYPILVFLDSHSETSHGWLEPLVARIHEDRTRVVVPNIRGLNLDKLTMYPGELWPPAKGSFNWRLTFTIVHADIDRDLVGDGHLHTRPIRSPVMPGGA